MSSVGFIEHKGKKILHIDLSNSMIDSVKKTIADAKAIISKQPQGSLLTLTDVSNLKVDDVMSSAIKEFANHNKPFVKAGAVLGVSGLKRITFNAVLLFTGRKNLHLFGSEAEAKDWLASQ